jgi:O-antigen ligase
MGFFDNPNTLGMICFISTPILLYKYKTARAKWTKLFNLVLIVTAIILPLIAASRASLLGIAIVFAVYFYFYNRRMFYIGTILALVSVFFVLVSPILLELMRLAEDPLSQRDKIWELGLAGWKENILFGAGYGTTEIFTSNIYMFLNKGLTEFVIGKRFGNIYIEILYETGIVGFLLFLTSILLLVKETWGIIKRSVSDERIFAVCYFGLLIAVILQSIFESFISSAGNVSSLIFWILTGLVIGRDSIKRINSESYK